MQRVVSDAILDQYTVDEKLDLLARVWDRLLDAGPPPIMEWHRVLLAERIAEAERESTARISLEDLRRKLLGDAS